MFIVSDIPNSAYNTGSLQPRENDETHRVLEIYILEDRYKMVLCDDLYLICWICLLKF